jgi:hypothetical protein
MTERESGQCGRQAVAVGIGPERQWEEDILGDGA